VAIGVFSGPSSRHITCFVLCMFKVVFLMALTPFVAMASPAYLSGAELEAHIRTQVRVQFKDQNPAPIVRCSSYLTGNRCKISVKVSGRCESGIGRSKLVAYSATVLVNRQKYNLEKTSMDACANRDALINPLLKAIPYQQI
jgi:hypothetical protein